MKTEKNDRLANAVLYLLRDCPRGQTQLLKLLYHVDYHHYRDHLRTITGAKYVALERGPVLDGWKDEFSALERRGFVFVREVPVVGLDPKQEYTALGEPSPDAFTAEELATLDDVLLQYGHKSGKTLSDLTHEELQPWEMVWDPADVGKPIPYALWRWMDNFASPQDAIDATKRGAEKEQA